MFTGIVTEKGEVSAFTREGEAFKLRVHAPETARDAAIGDSIAVDGCCLTVVENEEAVLAFDLLGESVRKTHFGGLRPGQAVNLESSLRFNGKVGGHFVSGHVDALGKVELFEARGADHYLRITPPEGFLRYLVYKGSVAINGVSLTVASVEEGAFSVWLIPHTLDVTNLGDLAEGQAVNLEFDLLAKYVERLLPGRAKDALQGLVDA